MARLIFNRLISAIFVVLGVSIICFAILALAPGDPTQLILPDSAPQAERDKLREELGLNEPLPERYLLYIGNVLKGDLGTSYTYKQPNSELIFQKLPHTFLLATSAMLLSLLIAIPLGILAGVKRGSLTDVFSMFFGMLGQSLSPVWLGILLIYIFSVKLSMLPPFGAESPLSIIMPSITLGIPLAALITRLTRAGMIDVLSEDFITATKAKGITNRKIVFKYAFKNVIIPIVTVVGLQFAGNIGGSIVTEEIFAWPGIGRLFATAIYNRDYPLIQSIMLVLSTVMVLINLSVDILYTFIDPRLRESRT